MRRCIVYLCLLLCVHLMQYHAIHTCPTTKQAENLTCYVNYVDYMSCTWYRGPHSGNGPFTLSALYEDGKTCDLVTISYEENLYSCDITNLYLDEMDKFNVKVHDSASSTLAEIKEFIPKCNIRLDPPSGLSYSLNGTIYRIIWTGIEDFVAETELQYELQLKKEASSWQEATSKYIDNSDTCVEILSSDFEKGSIYNVRIRCKTENQDYYKSQWSEWSSELKLHTLEKDRSHFSINHIIVIITLLMMILILLYLGFFSNLSTRIKIPFLRDVPTAAEFFQDLYLVHNGNFQDWTKYPNKRIKIKRERQSMDSELHSSTVLCFQIDMISSINLEEPPPQKDVPLFYETVSSESSNVSQLKNISLNEVYPSFSPDFTIFNDNAENLSILEKDCPADYISNDGTYIANQQELVK